MDGSDLKRISDRGRHPRWSPDGRKIAFTDGSNIFTINADGSNRRQLTDVSGQQRYLTPFWTPDGDQIVAEYYRLGTHDAWVQIDPETGEPTPWVQQHGIYCGYSRDGSRIVQWGWYYQFGFALLRPDGTDRQLLPQAIQGRDCMTLSPDGRYGVTKEYRSDADSRIDIVTWDLQTKEKRNLTNGTYGGYQGYSTWSPTGEWIVWGSNKERSGATGFGATDIWKIRPDGTGATKIVDGANPYHNWEHPDVQPRRGVAPEPEPTLEERKPDARAAAAAGVEGAEITLDASASKPGADEAAISKYEWDLDGDGVYTDAEGVAPKTTFGDEGTYSVGVLVTDATGKSSTATAEVTVTNAGPTITEARVDDGEPAGFSARISDPGTSDVQTAKVFWSGSETGETVPVIASGDGYVVIASRPGATSAKVVVSDGDGGEAEAMATRVAAPPNALPSADNATATVVAGEAVDIDLPARDPEGEPLEYEIVDEPSTGSVQLRDASPAPTAPDVTYVAGEAVGPVTFTYRVKAGGGQSGVATVTVDVTPTPGRSGRRGRARRAPDRARPAAGRASVARGHQARRPARRRGAHGRGAGGDHEGRPGGDAAVDQVLREPAQLPDPRQARRLPQGHGERERQAREGAARPARHRDGRPPRAAQGPLQGPDRRDAEERQGRPLHPAVPHLRPEVEDQEGRPGMRSVLIATAAVLTLDRWQRPPARAPPTTRASTTRWRPRSPARRGGTTTPTASVTPTSAIACTS